MFLTSSLDFLMFLTSSLDDFLMFLTSSLGGFSNVLNQFS